MKSKIIVVAFLVLMAFSFKQTIAAAQYTLVDLGTLGGTESRASGISENGMVIGYSAVGGSGGTHAFLYDGTLLKDLGTLGGTQSYAAGVNDRGQVVGYSYDAGDAISKAFLYENGIMRDLGICEVSSSFADGINNSGEITGSAHIDGSQGFLYRGGLTTYLGTLGGTWTSGEAINENGVIAGSSLLEGNTARHAFIYTTSIQDLHVDLGAYGYVSAINRNGWVVGNSSVNGPQHAFLCCGFGEVYTIDIDPGGSFSVAFDINNENEIVGVKRFGNVSHAFIYSDGAIADLNTLLAPGYAGWELLSASGINDNGWISGTCINPDGQTHAYLLKPIPEPWTLVLLAFGGPVLMRRRK